MARLFDRNNHIGLRHLAIRLADVDTLERIHQTLAEADEVGIEFSPEPLRVGPNTHMVC